MGEQGICSGTAALSQFSSLYGMPYSGEGHSWTLHRNYLFPISNNIEQGAEENSVEPIDKLTTVPSADSELPADGLTESQPESLPNPLPKQYKWVDLELARLATLGMISDESQAGQDQSAPLR